MELEKQVSRYSELTKFKWFIRVLLVSSVACVLIAKIYLTIYVIDLTVGLYSILTSFVLLNILVLSFFRYKDPYIEAQRIDISTDPPLVTIAVAVKNEEDNIRNCVQSCLNQTYQNKEIIIVNDGSTDKTSETLDDMRKENISKSLRIIHLSKSVGKKRAIEVASEVSNGEIYAFMDSDCDMAPDALEIAVKIFKADRRLGALTAHGRVERANNGTIIEKCQDVYIDVAFRAVKGAESSFNSVTCCSGSLSFYRRNAIQDFIHEWAHDKFLGQDFKFCTDRRMTAHVLESLAVSKNEDSAHIPIFQTGSDDIEIMKKSTDPDVHKESKHYWNVKYSHSIRVNVGVPTTILGLVKQQIRWKKSFIRSIFSTGGMFWKRPFYVALLYYIQTAMKFVRPFVLFYVLVMLPLRGDLTSMLFWFAGIMYTGMVYGVEFRLRNPGSKRWIFRLLFAFLTTFVYTWLLIYAALTIRNRSWR